MINIVRALIGSLFLMGSILGVEAVGQQLPFKIQSLTLRYKIDKILGYQSDPQHESNGYVQYQINGQIFLNGSGRIIAAPSTKRATPWETLAELLSAYQKKDTQLIKNLFTIQSQAKIEQTLSDKQKRGRFLDAIGSIQHMIVFIGFEYKGGFVVLIQTHEGEPPFPFYLVQESGQWKMSSFVDTGIMVTNIAMCLWKKP
jgi:hypothetical protein